MLQDIVYVYLAMAQYYILRLPYPVIVLIFVTVWYLPMGIALWILPWCFGRFIRIGQWCLYQMTRLFPALQDICSKMDSVLNSWGIWLEESGGTDDKENGDSGQKGRKRIPVTKIYVLILLVACVFLIIPYYMEPELTGNSQRVCADINLFMEKKVARAQKFVDQYYTPKVHEEEEIDEPERIIFHLGAKGKGGANLRSSPEKRSDNVVGTVQGDDELIFENEIQETKGIIWVKVSTHDVPEAWISKKLLNKKEAEAILDSEN